jgi:magnesium transporter
MIKSVELSHGALQVVERLDADVVLFSNPDAAERDLLHSHFKLDEHALASALDPDEVSRIEHVRVQHDDRWHAVVDFLW